jgi:hypothetical protein
MIQCRSHDSPVNVEEVGLDRNEGLNWRFALAVVGLCFVYKSDMDGNDPKASSSEADHFGFAWDIAMAVAPPRCPANTPWAGDFLSRYPAQGSYPREFAHSQAVGKHKLLEFRKRFGQRTIVRQ